MPKNKLSDLNNHLFEQLERLNDEELRGDDFSIEVHRAKAMTGLATQIVKNAQVMLQSMKMIRSGEITEDGERLIGMTNSDNNH